MFEKPTNSTNQPELDSNTQLKTIIMTFIGGNTTIPTGGNRYAANNYILRVVKKACIEGKEPHETEAILVKKGLITDIADQIEIHMRSGEVYTSIESYLTANAHSLRFADPWMYVEVLVTTSEYGSAWITGTQFEEESQPSKSQEIMPIPSPYVLPRGGSSYAVATYEIRHCKNTAPAQPSTKEIATLTIRDINDHYIKDKLGQHYFSLAQWHLKNPFATEDDIAKDLKKNGSPWSLIDVLVGNKWVTGPMFLAQRNPAQPECDGPVPRSYGATIYDEYMDALPYDTEEFIDALINRESRNLTVTEIMEQFGPGIPEGYTFNPEEFALEFERSYMNPEYYWNDISFQELMHNFGPQSPRSAITINDIEEDIDYDAQEFENAFVNRKSRNLSVTEIMEQFGPGIPQGYSFNPDEFTEEFERRYLNPENYWDELSFQEVMHIFGPQPPRQYTEVM